MNIPYKRGNIVYNSKSDQFGIVIHAYTKKSSYKNMLVGSFDGIPAKWDYGTNLIVDVEHEFMLYEYMNPNQERLIIIDDNPGEMFPVKKLKDG